MMDLITNFSKQGCSYDLHFYSLKTISKLNSGNKKFLKPFSDSKRFSKFISNSKWNQEKYKMVSGGG